jgi:twitching motility protein PilT
MQSGKSVRKHVARIDGLLRLVLQQGADELRLATEREPKMFARGAPKRLSVPATSEETLRILLGDIISPEVEASLNERGSAETSYEAARLGLFRVLFKRAAAGGFDVRLLHAEVHGAEVKAAAPPGPEADTAAAEPAQEQPAPVVHAKAVHAAPLPKQTLPMPVVSNSALPVAKPQLATRAETPVSIPTARDHRDHEDLNELVRSAASVGASDLHLAEGELPRARVDGKLTALSQSPVAELPNLLELDDATREQLTRSGSVDLALELPKLGRLRVHVYRTDRGFAAALRLLPRAAPSFSDLNMPVAFDDLIDLPHGLVLVCGAAGAGKSTTLAALAQELLRRRSVVLVTLEDPIEYTLTPSAHSIVRRRQIGRDVRDFPSGLRDALRADPEVLVVGEMRDPESIALALTAAETGHLVLASLHSGSASSAIERIVDAYPSTHKEQIRAQLADALRAIVVQRLLPRAHGGGRIPAIELLRVTRAVASLIREGKSSAQLPTVLQSSRREGMLGLERSLADRVLAGEVQLSAATAAANDPESLMTYLGAAKTRTGI